MLQCTEAFVHFVMVSSQTDTKSLTSRLQQQICVFSEALPSLRRACNKCLSFKEKSRTTRKQIQRMRDQKSKICGWLFSLTTSGPPLQPVTAEDLAPAHNHILCMTSEDSCLFSCSWKHSCISFTKGRLPRALTMCFSCTFFFNLQTCLAHVL